jgi:hypothetical protein
VVPICRIAMRLKSFRSSSGDERSMSLPVQSWNFGMPVSPFIPANSPSTAALKFFGERARR